VNIKFLFHPPVSKDGLRRAEPGAASPVFSACEFAKKTATWFCSSASHC
jgi:hypothetical protein